MTPIAAPEEPFAAPDSRARSTVSTAAMATMPTNTVTIWSVTARSIE